MWRAAQKIRIAQPMIYLCLNVENGHSTGGETAQKKEQREHIISCSTKGKIFLRIMLKQKSY